MFPAGRLDRESQPCRNDFELHMSVSFVITGFKIYIIET